AGRRYSGAGGSPPVRTKVLLMIFQVPSISANAKKSTNDTVPQKPSSTRTAEATSSVCSTEVTRAWRGQRDSASNRVVPYDSGGPDVLRYEDVPDPECLDGCVLIDVEAISIEGGDLLARVGSPPPSVPHIVGYLAAGTVVAVGAGVEDRAAGDRVVSLNMAGSHASKRAVPAMSSWPIPDGLDAAPAACVPGAFGT